MTNSKKPYARAYLRTLLVVSVLVVGLSGCKGSSSNSSSIPSSSETELESPQSNTQANFDCNTSTTSLTPQIISGIIKFLDKDFDQNGLTGTTTCKPVKYADVQIVKSSDSSVLASGMTDSLGRYAISGTNLLGETVYVRALTSSAISNKKITVKSGTSNSLYSVISEDFLFGSDGVVKELTVPVDSVAARPFNLFSVMMNGAIFIETITGAVLPSGTTGFYPNAADDGTYFSPPDIYICAKCGVDDDGWDDTVIMHEFGHFVANVYSKDDSQGGHHTLAGHFELPLTWSEGWATFFSSALRDFLGIPSPEYYVDTNGTNGSNLAIAYEIETPSLSSDTIGADNEVAVSAMLWDIYDFTNEAGFDTISTGIGNTGTGIWDVFRNYLPLTDLVSLEDFWDGWFARGNGTLGATGDVTGIFEARKTYYREDTKEPDDTAGSATALTVGNPLTSGTPDANLTFYPAGDVDWFSFSYIQGKTYTVETTNLGDGADPSMEIYSDPSQPAVCTNDDISTTNVNAQIKVHVSCPGLTTGTLYVKLFPSADATNPAEYGNYNIKITP